MGDNSGKPEKIEEHLEFNVVVVMIIFIKMIMIIMIYCMVLNLHLTRMVTDRFSSDPGASHPMVSLTSLQ